VYGELQIVQHPCQCTGLVKQIYIENVPTNIIIPTTVITNESGMKADEEQEHIQFITNTTFRVKMMEQVQKEKKAVQQVTKWDIRGDFYSEDDE
jgi:hypothetical protein